MLFLLLAIIATPAGAHSELEYSDPVRCEVVTTIDRVVLGFGQELATDTSTFSIVDESGRTVAIGGLDLNDLDRKTLHSVLAGPLALGTYNIDYVAVNVLDGDALSGSIPFVVGNPSVGNPSVDTGASDGCPGAATPTNSGSVANPIVVLASVLLLAGLSAMLVRSKVRA